MIDLHTHSTASDGISTPGELVTAAVKAGVRTLAVTDHDTISGIAGAVTAASQYRLRFIPGVELSTNVARNEVHILGYFIDPENEALNKELERLQKGREKRIYLILDRLEDLGLNPGWEKVNTLSRGKSPGRPHIARAMVEAGFVKSMEEAFGKYLVKGSPCYIPREKLTPEDSVRLIVDAGGIPVLAHPGLVGSFDVVFPYLLNIGIKGIECYYPEHSPEKTDYYVKLAKKHDLVITAGSDYHGPVGKSKAVTPGMPNVPAEVINAITELYKLMTGVEG